MENNSRQEDLHPEIVLSKKERILEIVATAMCFMLLLASFMKVMFF